MTCALEPNNLTRIVELIIVFVDDSFKDRGCGFNNMETSKHRPRFPSPPHPHCPETGPWVRLRFIMPLFWFLWDLTLVGVLALQGALECASVDAHSDRRAHAYLMSECISQRGRVAQMWECLGPRFLKFSQTCWKKQIMSTRCVPGTA